MPTSTTTPNLSTQLLFSRKECVLLLSMSLRKVDSLIADGSLRVRRVGGCVRIHRDTLIAFAKQGVSR